MKRQSKDPQYLCFELARRAKEDGIKPTAKLFSTTPKTVPQMAEALDPRNPVWPGGSKPSPLFAECSRVNARPLWI